MTTELDCERLGDNVFSSPLLLRRAAEAPRFITGERVLRDIEVSADGSAPGPASFEKAGPRERIFFDPKATRAGIVTCGGLCPGINSAIRAIYLELHHLYGVPEVLGFRNGFDGLTQDAPDLPWVLSPERVRSIHRSGGSILGTSRGQQDPAAMVDTLERRGVDILFAIGGEGTLRGAKAIGDEVRRRGKPIAVVAIPKTIDNDIPYVDKTFGFDTAVRHARHAVDAAHTEATGVRHGIGIVKLMGRDAGFVAAAAVLASSEANICLIPEYPFSAPKLFAALRRRIEERGHAVVVVAEGCGRCLVTPNAERDPSGNLRYASKELDVGPHLRDEVIEHFRAIHLPVTVKYIDPSYMVRTAPPTSSDGLYAGELGRHAVHAAMAGHTNVLVGRCHGVYAHVPFGTVVSTVRRVDAELWRTVCEVTGQPSLAP